MFPHPFWKSLWKFYKELEGWLSLNKHVYKHFLTGSIFQVDHTPKADRSEMQFLLYLLDSSLLL
jgi:hypothetical protein